MGSGGGSSTAPVQGRALTSQELQLIQAQTQAFNADQQRAAGVYGAAGQASNRALAANDILSQQINNTTQQLGGIQGQALQVGMQRKAQEAGILNSQLGVPGQIAALGRQIPSLNLGNMTNMAYNDAGANRGSPAADELQYLLGVATRDANQGGRPLRALANQTPVQQQIGALSSLGSQAGAAEQALTPGAIQALQQVQQGQVPTAVGRLFSGTDTAARGQLENQFSAARQRLIESGVTGGALTRAMAGLEGQRAMGVAGQVEARENEARNFSANMLQQATTYGLNRPDERQMLQLQGLQAGGQMGLAQHQLRGNQINQAANIRHQFLQTAMGGAEAMGNQALGFGQLRNQQLGLAGQLQNQQFQGNLAANQARQQAQLSSAGLSMDLAGQLGAGGDALAYQTAPALATQMVQMRNLGSQAQGIPIDILRGGMSGSGVDLSGALAAAGSAGSFQGPPRGPSQGQRALGGALSGGATGAMAGSMFGPWGTLIGGVAGAGMGVAGAFL